ncbi:MAG: glycosyltransferase family A protein [Patescibacteria group bacterium]
MKQISLTGHMIIRNEEQWVWYAIQSALRILDRLLIFDTGSTDDTVKIINSIKSPKIIFEQKSPISVIDLVTLRNEQLKRTKTNWFLLLDGDEVWPQDTTEELSQIITAKKNIAAIAVKARVPVGDLMHYQPFSAGKYHILGKSGHFNVRVYKKLDGYNWQGTYPLEAYQGPEGIPIQNQNEKVLLLDHEYWHLTHLRRSKFDNHGKTKLEIGIKKSVTLPQVFSLERPNIVPSPWVSFNFLQQTAAFILTPLRKLKRRLNY